MELFIDKEMKKREMREASSISRVTIAKLGRKENITTDVLVEIYYALGCDISGSMEVKFINKITNEDIKE